MSVSIDSAQKFGAAVYRYGQADLFTVPDTQENNASLERLLQLKAEVGATDIVCAATLAESVLELLRRPAVENYGLPASPAAGIVLHLLPSADCKKPICESRIVDLCGPRIHPPIPDAAASSRTAKQRVDSRVRLDGLISFSNKHQVHLRCSFFIIFYYHFFLSCNNVGNWNQPHPPDMFISLLGLCHGHAA